MLGHDRKVIQVGVKQHILDRLQHFQDSAPLRCEAGHLIVVFLRAVPPFAGR